MEKVKIKNTFVHIACQDLIEGRKQRKQNVTATKSRKLPSKQKVIRNCRWQKLTISQINLKRISKDCNRNNSRDHFMIVIYIFNTSTRKAIWYWRQKWKCNLQPRNCFDNMGGRLWISPKCRWDYNKLIIRVTQKCDTTNPRPYTGKNRDSCQTA